MNSCPSIGSGQAGKSEGCKGCPNANVCASLKPDEDILLIKDNLSSVKHIISVLSGKGGVGKSTVAKNIAQSLSELGHKTIIVDFDISGPSIPRLTNTFDKIIHYSKGIGFEPIHINDNLSSVSMGYFRLMDENRSFDSNSKTYAIKHILKNCNLDGFEYMIIDTPPNITDEHLAIANYIKSSFAIIVSTPHHLSLDDAVRQISFCSKANISIIGVLENMKTYICSHCNHPNNLFPYSYVETYCKENKINYLGALPMKQSIAKASDCGSSISDPFFEDMAHYIIRSLK